MSFRRVVIAALVVAAAVPAPAAYATFMDNPGPKAAEDASPAMQMRVLRDQDAPDPPPVAAASRPNANPPAGGFPWLDAAIPAGLVALLAAGVGLDRRRRVAVAAARG